MAYIGGIYTTVRSEAVEQKRTEEKILKNKVSAYLNKRFNMKEYVVDEKHPANYLVRGSMLQYGEKVNVEVTVEKDGLTPVYWCITDQKLALPVRKIGKINLGKDVCVSDPCYDKTIWCMRQLHNVKPGVWDVEAAIGEIDCWGERIYILTLYHEDFEITKRDLPLWENYGSLGVDSGQMSVFDDPYYGWDFTYSKSRSEAKDDFYKACCRITSSPLGISIYYAGEKAVGVVTSSGCGDGLYPLSVVIEQDKIVAMQIDFT